MVSLRAGDVLSTILPGAVVVFAIAPFSSTLTDWLNHITQAGPGIALLVATALMGGLLEAWTRISWERYVLNRWCKSPSVLHTLRESQLHLDLYERGVQSSYKYVTFYANFAWAVLVLASARLAGGVWQPCSAKVGATAASFIVLLVASYIQWTYFVNYLEKVFLTQGAKMLKNDPPAGTKVKFGSGLNLCCWHRLGRCPTICPSGRYRVARADHECDLRSVDLSNKFHSRGYGRVC